MTLKVKRIGSVEAVKRYSGATDDIVESDGTVVDSAGERPLGIIIDDIPTDSPPEMLTVYGQGSIIEDSGLTSVNASVGDLLYSDGDGTYSTAKPSGSTPVWIWAVVRKADTSSIEYEIDIDAFTNSTE